MQQFDNILRASTEAVTWGYFELPIAGEPFSVYRERAYCYELYHQMRLKWPQESQYSLGGEIDKGGHPLFRGNGLDDLKPDFLIHVPGTMDENYAIIEVKPITARPKQINKDIQTLAAFHAHAGYQRTLFLLFGDGGLDALPEAGRRLLGQAELPIEIWIHRIVGHPAERAN